MVNEALFLLARSNGIAVTLSPVSKAIVGVALLAALGLVGWVMLVKPKRALELKEKSDAEVDAQFAAGKRDASDGDATKGDAG